MGLHKKNQILELIGLENTKSNRDKVGMWIKRGNIIVKDDLIDDTDPQNSFWIKKQKDLAQRNIQVVDTPVNESIVQSKEEIPTSNKLQLPAANNPSKTQYELNTEKKELEIEKLKVDTRIQELREEKMRGEVIPIELIKNVFTQHTQSIVTEYKNAIENILTVFSKRKALTGNEAAEIRGELVFSINSAVDKAIEMSKKNVDNIIKDFSVKRDVGQHD